jgi:hypothetical protein
MLADIIYKKAQPINREQKRIAIKEGKETLKVLMQIERSFIEFLKTDFAASEYEHEYTRHLDKFKRAIESLHPEKMQFIVPNPMYFCNKYKPVGDNYRGGAHLKYFVK